MRRLIAYLTALILVLSCMAEPEQGGTAVDASLEGAPVTITFSVPDIPVLPATKTWDTGDGDITGTAYLDPDKLYLVVCGGTQSIKYIRKAELIDQEDNVEIPQQYYPLSEGDRHTTLYTFKVQLELSDGDRTIHILGNVDENQLIAGAYSYENLPGLLSYVNKQAYWQKLYVPFIKAKKDPVTQEPKIEDGCYVPDDETKGFFQYIPLIRNFAKIRVTNATENFHLHSYAVIYYPERGSVVPYRSNEPDTNKRFDFHLNPHSGFHLSGYESSSFKRLQDTLKYPGNMPASITLSNVIPDASEFETPTPNGRVLLYDHNDKESGFYIYERGIPTDQVDPTFIIICGKFDENDPNWYYYRLDLMETKVEGTQTVTNYYPIFRNFRYDIQLHRISSEGVLTPELAAVSSGAEDISADVSMRHLSDISDGTTRLVVDPFMTKTYTKPADEGEYYTLYARFFNSVYSDVPNTEYGDVWVELEAMTDGSNDILILYDSRDNPVYPVYFPEAETVGGVEGMRIIRFNTVEPLSETKTQKIKITGYDSSDPHGQRLYREVEITLQKKQPLTVSCPNIVSASTNTPVDVSINIPTELPESMFPLEFIVEPEARTLTPDTVNNINMPVRSGRSIATIESTYKDTPAFYYLRTLTWEEYLGLPESNSERTFHCYFKTNRDVNATTIWVYNEYFDKDHASYKNTLLPLTLTCTNPVLAVVNTPITVELTIHPNIPKSYFPMEFIIEPEDWTIMSEDLEVVQGSSIVTGQTTVANQFIRELTWDEYTNLPVTGNGRTFSCDFKSSVDWGETTIWAYNELFSKAHVIFHNIAEEPKNHFWVEAIDNCTVKLKKGGLWYKVDDGGWLNYTSEQSITLDAGHKVSFKGGSADSPISWKDTDKGAFKGTGGQFKVGGNFASLIVGDDYPNKGEKVTNVAFLDFFKEQTYLVDAYELELPMKKLTTNAYKSMFDGCTNLVRGPQFLPATELGNTCYRNMFYKCTSLVYAPALPAAALVNGAYQRMFYDCSSLHTITMLGTNYRSDVFICTESTINPHTGNKTFNWCDGVASTGDIWLNATLENATNWNTTWKNIIPAGWTVHFGNQ